MRTCLSDAPADFSGKRSHACDRRAQRRGRSRGPRSSATAGWASSPRARVGRRRESSLYGSASWSTP